MNEHMDPGLNILEEVTRVLNSTTISVINAINGFLNDKFEQILRIEMLVLLVMILVIRSSIIVVKIMAEMKRGDRKKVHF